MAEISHDIRRASEPHLVQGLQTVFRVSVKIREVDIIGSIASGSSTSAVYSPGEAFSNRGS